MPIHIKNMRCFDRYGHYDDKQGLTFAPTVEISNGRRVWVMVHRPNICLRFTSSNKWMVSDIKDKGANNLRGLCTSEAGVAHPTMAKKWKVFEDGKFRAQAGVMFSIQVWRNFFSPFCTHIPITSCFIYDLKVWNT